MRRKGFKYVVFCLIVIVFVGTFVYLFRNSRPQVENYETFHSSRQTLEKSTIITGKIVPRNEVNIKPQISGIISEIYKEAGEVVKEGEVIAKVKVIPEMSSLSAAQSRLRLAEINLSQAQTDYDRDKALFDKALISAAEFDRTSQLLAQAKEERASAQESLEVIRDGVSKNNANSSSTLIRSTITGLILDIPVKAGNSVILSNTFNDGTTIATVANMNDLIFDGNIDETEVGRISEGMPTIITIGALQNVRFDAVLEYISPKATENNGTNQFEVKAAVKVSPDIKIRSGYSANAEIILERAENVLTIPESAIYFESDSSFVYVALDTAPSSWEKRAVSTGLSDGMNIEIKSGISEEDIIRGNRIYPQTK